LRKRREGSVGTILVHIHHAQRQPGRSRFQPDGDGFFERLLGLGFVAESGFHHAEIHEAHEIRGI
jgi:hypothetical protein